MQIKKFRANDTAEALRQIRKEFGPRAVILSSKDVEIGSRAFGLRKKYGVEVTAATDSEPPKLDPGYGSQGVTFRKPNAEKPVAPILLKRGNGAISSRNERELSRVGRIKPAKLRNGFFRKTNHRMQFFSLYKELQDHGVKDKLAMELVQELGESSLLKKSFSEEDLRRAVKETLAKMGAAAEPIRVAGGQRIAAMVGPAGVGKTTTIAKLAGMGGLKQGRKLGLITLDDIKIGAVGELQVYSRIFDIPMEVASSRNDLEHALHRFRKKDIILIDTPGISRNEHMLFRRIQDLLKSSESVEVHLLASAMTREKEFKEILNRFEPMNVKSLIFTGLDNCTAYGDLINHLIETGIPASYFSNGPQVPENIEVASLDRLVKLVLKKKHVRNTAQLATPGTDNRNQKMTYGPYLEKSYAYS